MKSLIALTSNTFKETIRDRILYTIVFFALLLVASTQLLASLSSGEGDKVVLDSGLAMVHIFGIIITLFMGTQLIAKEMDSKTILVLLSKPLSRRDFIFGKFFGLSLVLLLLVMLMGGVFFFLVDFSWDLFIALAGIYMSVLLLLALALFFSSFISPLFAMLATLLMFVIGNITDDFYVFVEQMVARGEASGMFYWTGWGSYHFLPSFENVNFKNMAAYGIEFAPWEIALKFAITFLYIGFLLFLASKFFEKKEF